MMWKPSVASNQTPQIGSNQPLANDSVVKTNVATFPTAQPQALIGKSIRVKGEIIGAESLRIEGRVEGTVNLEGCSLHVARDATVMSRITARELIVCGTVQGNSTVGDRLEIRQGGSLTGNVMTKRIAIEDGAHFKGSIDMRQIDHKSNGDESVQSAPVSNEAGVTARSLEATMDE